VERPFLDASIKPVELAVAAALGSTHARYRSILELADGFAEEWTFNRSSGWMLKIHDGRKALVYLIPLNDAFRMSLAIREAERDELLREADLAPVHEKLASAKKYSEGFALQFDVDSEMDFGPVESFVGRLISLRK
jgi:hypothetical protein